MPYLNKVMVMGHVGRDPETRYSQDGGTAITRMSVATSRRTKGQDGNYTEETEWHTISIFGKQAEAAAKYLKKGSAVFVEGRLRTRKWQKDGIDRYSTEIICENWQFAGAKGETAEGGEQPASQQFEKPVAAPKPQKQAYSRNEHNFETDDIPF